MRQVGDEVESIHLETRQRHKEKEEDEEVEVEGALLSPMTRKQRVTVETTM